MGEFITDPNKHWDDKFDTLGGILITLINLIILIKNTLILNFHKNNIQPNLTHYSHVMLGLGSKYKCFNLCQKKLESLHVAKE